MQNLITLVGLATLANAASLVSRTESNVHVDGTATTQDPEANLELGSSFSQLRQMCQPKCKEEPKDECCQQYLNKYCDFTLDSISTTTTIPQTKVIKTDLELPASFRFVAIQSSTVPAAAICNYEVYWQDVANPTTKVLIFANVASTIPEMVQLEIGSASSYATIWDVETFRQSCQNACPPKTQTVYQRTTQQLPLLTSDLTWYYPLATENNLTQFPKSANLISANLGNLSFEIPATADPTCVINFRQLQMIDTVFIFDDQTGCSNGDCCTGGCNSR